MLTFISVSIHNGVVFFLNKLLLIIILLLCASIIFSDEIAGTIYRIAINKSYLKNYHTGETVLTDVLIVGVNDSQTAPKYFYTPIDSETGKQIKTLLYYAQFMDKKICVYYTGGNSGPVTNYGGNMVRPLLMIDMR